MDDRDKHCTGSKDITSAKLRRGDRRAKLPAEGVQSCTIVLFPQFFMSRMLSDDHTHIHISLSCLSHYLSDEVYNNRVDSEHSSGNRIDGTPCTSWDKRGSTDH
jgi:hypothetical protein